ALAADEGARSRHEDARTTAAPSRLKRQVVRREESMSKSGTLYLLCGKMAAGKSTLARELAERGAAILLVQDEWLSHLFPGEIVDVSTFARFSARLRAALTDHICTLLSRGASIVLDFPGNTRTQRDWFRVLFGGADSGHAS